MKLNRTALAAALAAAILTPCVALGAGYGVYEQGAAVLGMAGAGTASVHDASADFYNAASLVRLDGKQAYFGGSWLTTHTSFAGVYPYPGFGTTEAMKTGNFYPPTFYWSNHLAPRWAYGVGVNSPFGLGVEWENPDLFSGREIVTKGTLRTINGNFSLSYALNDAVSVGAGFDALFAGVELNSVFQKIMPGSGGGKVNIAHAQLKGDYKSGYGFNAGVLWSANPSWKFAASYRGKVDVTIDDGKATFKQILTGNAGFDKVVGDSVPPNQKVGTLLHFPAILSLAAAWNPTPSWTWEVDANMTGWSTFDNLPLTFVRTPAINDTLVEKYGDSWRIGVGAEHRLAKFSYRFGYYYDQAAAPASSVTPLLPDANRHGITLGLGWTLGAKKAWALDVYNLALIVEKRSTEGKNRDDFNGIYKSYVNASGLSLAYHW
jgi:long-chain fatty acid transport protein